MRSTTISRYNAPTARVAAPALTSALLFARFLIAPTPAHADDVVPAPAPAAQTISARLEKIDTTRFREIRTAAPSTEPGVSRMPIRDLERTSNVFANAELRMAADGSMTIVQPSPSQAAQCEGVVLTVTINGARVNAMPLKETVRERTAVVNELAAEVQPQVDTANRENAEFVSCFEPERRGRRRPAIEVGERRDEAPARPRAERAARIRAARPATSPTAAEIIMP